MNQSPSPAIEARGARRPLGLLAVAALLAASLAGRPAEAGQTITAKSVYNNNGGTVAATYNNGTISFNTGSVGSGSFTTTFLDSSIYGPANSTFETYCVDLAINLNPATVTGADVSYTNAQSVIDAKGVLRNIAAAGWVLNQFGGYDLTSTAGLTAFKTALGFASTSVSQAEARTAIQVAIWEAAYDSQQGGSSTTDFVGTGNLIFTSINTTAKNLANAILAQRGTQTSFVGFINYPPILNGNQTPTNQDQLFLPPEGALNAIPEPSTLAMAALGGVIGLGVMGRRRLLARKGRA